MPQIGRYEVNRELGRGAMGVVFEARDPFIGRLVAIKTIRLDTLGTPSEADWLRDRLFREARSAGVLSHPGIVAVHDMGVHENTAYMAMEFVDGPTLEQVMATGARLQTNEALTILRQTAAALDYAHQNGVVHRDIKPGNLMLHKGSVLKITDFGIAKITGTQQLTRTGMVLGTPSYMSPEQITAKPVDGRADQFSLAVIAFEILAGRKPFVADTLAGLVHQIIYEERPSVRVARPDFPESVDAVLKKGLAKETADRYPSCVAFIEALSGVLTLSAPASAPVVVSQPMHAPAYQPAPQPAPSALAQPVPKQAPPLSGVPPRPAPTGRLWAAAAFLIVAAIPVGWWALQPNQPKAPTTPVASPITPQPVPVKGPVPQPASVAEEPKTSPPPSSRSATKTFEPKPSETQPLEAKSAETKPLAPPIIASFTTDRQSIKRGQSATLRWSVSDAKDLRIDPDLGSVDSKGSREMFPANSTTYTLTAKGPGGEVSQKVTVEVTAPVPAPVITRFDAAPESVGQRKGFVLRWASSNAAEVRIDPDVGRVAPSGSITVFPAKTTIFTLVATGPGGEDRRTLTAEVAAAAAK